VPGLLVVHHTPPPALQAMFEAAAGGARADQIEGVEVVLRSALTAAAADVLAAGCYLPGTPADIGCMSGALKHFFGGICYPCLAATRRRPCGLYVHGNPDTGGAVRAAGVDHRRPAMARGPAGRMRHRGARQAGSAGLLGTGRTARGRDRRMIIARTPIAAHRPGPAQRPAHHALS